MAAKCSAFKSGCPFKGCKTVGEFEDKLGQMRDQCKGDAAYLEFLRVTHLTAKGKELDVGSTCPLFQTKGGCPFAKDTSGKPVLFPDYIVVCASLLSMPFRSNAKLLLLVSMSLSSVSRSYRSVCSPNSFSVLAGRRLLAG